MNKILLILCLVLLTSCSPSQEEKEKVAAVTCAIMSETRNMDAAVRVEKMNEARDKIGEVDSGSLGLTSLLHFPVFHPIYREVTTFPVETTPKV